MTNQFWHAEEVKVSPLQALLFAIGLFAAGLAFGYLLTPSSPDATHANGLPRAGAGGERTGAETAEMTAGGAFSGSETAGRLLAAVSSRDFFKRRHDLYEIAQTLDADAVRRALEDSEKFGPYARGWVQPQLVARWTELDPEGAFAWTSKVPAKQRSPLMVEFYETLGLKNPGLIAGFLQRSKEIGNDGERHVSEAFAAWATHSPQEAADATLRLDKSMAQSARRGVFRRWSQGNPREALLAAQTVPEAEKSSILGVVFENWAERDLTAASDAAEALTDAAARRSALSKVIAKAGERDRAQGIQMLDALPADERRRVAAQISDTGYFEDARFVAEVCKYLPASRELSMASQLGSQLGRLDPDAAIKWVDSLRSEEAKKSALRSVLLSWASAEPKAAFEYQLTHQALESPYSNSAFSNWSSADPEAAWAWLQKMPESQGKTSAMTSAITGFARTDPQRAIREAEAVPAERRGAVVRGIATAWAAKDADAALAWAQNLPEQERYESVGGAIGVLARTNVTEAAKWIEKQTDLKMRDVAAGRFAHAVVEDDPEGAMAWVKSISAESSRDSVVSTIAQTWKRNDPAGFEAWRTKGNAVPERALR